MGMGHLELTVGRLPSMEVVGAAATCPLASASCCSIESWVEAGGELHFAQCQLKIGETKNQDLNGLILLSP